MAELIEQRRLLLRPAIVARIKRMDQPGMLGDAAFRDTGSALRKEGQSFLQIAEAIEGTGRLAPGDRDQTSEPLHPIASEPFYQMASEPDRKRVLRMVSKLARSNQRVFVGVIDPISPVVETPSEVRDRILEAALFLSEEQLGTTDDCGFAPFADDVSTARDTAFRKIRARVEGTALAAQELGW